MGCAGSSLQPPDFLEDAKNGMAKEIHNVTSNTDMINDVKGKVGGELDKVKNSVEDKVTVGIGDKFDQGVGLVNGKLGSELIPADVKGKIGTELEKVKAGAENKVEKRSNII